MDLFTIGHSNHSIETFLDLLHQHQVTAVADVRSHPHSRYLPHFNKDALKAALVDQRLQYVFLGQELGARPQNLDCYVEGKAMYEKIAGTVDFQQGLNRIVKGAEKYKIALMCAEKDPLTCHRAILICQHLRKFDLEISHILNDGNLESHHHLEDRLLIQQGFQEVADSIHQVQLSLFRGDLPSREDCLAKAYQLQGNELAYVEQEEREHD